MHWLHLCIWLIFNKVISLFPFVVFTFNCWSIFTYARCSWINVTTYCIIIFQNAYLMNCCLLTCRDLSAHAFSTMLMIGHYWQIILSGLIGTFGNSKVCRLFPWLEKHLVLCQFLLFKSGAIFAHMVRLPIVLRVVLFTSCLFSAIC